MLENVFFKMRDNFTEVLNPNFLGCRRSYESAGCVYEVNTTPEYSFL